MAIDERQRHQLHERLDEVLGVEEAAILMGHLPLVGWANLATKHDLDTAAAQLRSEVSASESRLRAEISELRGELRTGLSGVRTELGTEVGGLRADLHRELGGLRAELHKEVGGVRSDLVSMHRQLLFAIVASQFTAVSLAFAATSL